MTPTRSVGIPAHENNQTYAGMRQAQCSVGIPAHDNNDFILWFFDGLFFGIWGFVGRNAHATELG